MGEDSGSTMSSAYCCPQLNLPSPDIKGADSADRLGKTYLAWTSDGITTFLGVLRTCSKAYRCIHVLYSQQIAEAPSRYASSSLPEHACAVASYL